jgi:hypothetical protein
MDPAFIFDEHVVTDFVHVPRHGRTTRA